MPPASNQLFSFNDVASEVSAGRMVWSGSAQSGNSPISWSQFITYISNDGTNPRGYASNQCVAYSDAMARAVTIKPPTSIVGVDGHFGQLNVSWVAPASGLTPTSYNVQFMKNGANFGTLETGVGSPWARTGYTSGDTAFAEVQSVNGTNLSAFANSNDVTMGA